MLPTLLVSLTVLIIVAVASPELDGIYNAPVYASRGLPIAGEIWGPVITHAGTIQDTQDGLIHTYGYSTEDQKDVLVDYVLTSQIFRNKEAMYEHLQSVIEKNNVIIQADPVALEGKYLEILTTKVAPLESVKVTCHSAAIKPAFCHQIGIASTGGHDHEAKMMYSMVKEKSSGKAFPCLFFSHKVCTEKNNAESCYWVSHINEIVILDKSLV